MINNETIGISCEIAIADAFNINVNNNYIIRGNSSLINVISPKLKKFFLTKNIPFPIKHTAENQNSIDFELINSKTLSVKSNKKKLGKVAPQKIGQPTSKTALTYFKTLDETLKLLDINTLTSIEAQQIFKKLALTKT